MLLKALGVIFIASVFISVLKNKSGGFSILITVLAVCTVGVYVLLSVWDSAQKLKNQLEGQSLNTEYYKIALKALFIAYISETVADTCRDFGQSAMANKAVLAGKCVIFVLSVPLFTEILNIALSFLKL